MKPPFTVTLTINLYNSASDLKRLLSGLEEFAKKNAANFSLECIFVSDGSPDNSVTLLQEALPHLTSFRSQLIELSRNFGATYALRCALAHGNGDFYAPLPPDLQEPFSLLEAAIFHLRSGKADLCLGRRIKRHESTLVKVQSQVYWWLYRKFINPDFPRGGIDFMAYTRRVRDEIIALNETSSFFPAMVMALGFRRVFIDYERVQEKGRKSSWSLRKKLNYALDGIFQSSLLPLRLLMVIGFISTGLGIGGLLTQAGPGPVFWLVCFFGGVHCVAFGVSGEYLFRVLKNTQGRPIYLVSRKSAFNYR